MKKGNTEYKRLKSKFSDVDANTLMTTFYEPDSLPVSAEKVRAFVTSCRRNGVIRVIPSLPAGGDPKDFLADSAKLYADLTSAALGQSVSVGLNIDRRTERCFFASGDNEDIRGKVLLRHEYFPEQHEHIRYKLHDGILMSLVAFDDDNKAIMDLRGNIDGEYLDVTLPTGNWGIHEYVCSGHDRVTDTDILACDIMNYKNSLAFLSRVRETLLSDADQSAVTALYMGDIGFNAPNRRNWTPDFNTHFTAKYGFDPAPLYPVLYHNIGPHTRHIKALFMECRAELFRMGLIKALGDYANANGFQLISNITEPKLQASSWINGDALADNFESAGAICDNAYLYGVNSIKLAASAAECVGKSIVSCELYRNYNSISEKTALKEALNSLARGANMLLTHPIRCRDAGDVPEQKILRLPGQRDFVEFASRVQSVLREGINACEICMLYPAYYLYSGVYLFEYKPDEVEYPDTSSTVDYMCVMNSVTMYSGHDITMLHPQTLDRHCTVENGVLTLSTPAGKKDFRILILPACSMISLSNLRILQKFYDTGGKIVATGKLPVYAYEYSEDFYKKAATEYSDHPHSTDNDVEARNILRHIFGGEVMDKGVITGHCHNSNENGGATYFLYSSQTAADGTYMTPNAIIDRAINSFNIPLDVYLPDMPKLEGSGVFNTTFKDYVTLGLRDTVPGGGMISHIHKRIGDIDVLYIVNTTDRTMGGYAYIRGALECEIWNPHTGKTRKTECEHVRYLGEIYTCIKLRLPSDRSALVISKPTEPGNDIREIQSLK